MERLSSVPTSRILVYVLISWLASYEACASPKLATAVNAQASDGLTFLSVPIKRLDSLFAQSPAEENPAEEKVVEKDTWDKLNAISGLISGGFVTAVGIAATYLYNERQRKNSETQKTRELKVLQAQTVQSFMPQLQSEDQKAIKAALLAIYSLGNEKLAKELAGIYGNEGAIAALSQIASNPERPDAEAVTVLSKIASGPDPDAARQAEKSLELLFRTLTESIVSVGTELEDTPRGCGFFVSRDGVLVTPNFVTNEAETIVVTFNGGRYKASLVSVDNASISNQLTVLKVDGTDFPVLPIAKKVSVDIGEEIFILGPDWRRGEWSFSSGTVVGYTINDSGERYVKVDASVSPGYAGTPAINRKSEVVGIVVARDNTHAYLLDVEVIFQLMQKIM